VKALAYLGYIKNIKILQPHIAELSEQLHKSFLLPADDLSENEIDVFLEEIHLQKLRDLKILAEQNKLKQYLAGMAPNAESIFKANYILSEIYWNKRSNRLFHGTDDKKPLITYDDQLYNPIHYLESGLFKKVEKAISSGDRENLTINNFRDTVALCMIKEKIPDRNDNPKKIPFFFVSHDVYFRLTDEIHRDFSYVSRKNGRRIYLIKDAEYFIIQTIFSQEKNAGNKVIEHREAFDKLKDIKKSFDIYRNIDAPFPHSEIKPLIDKWDKYRNYEFFQLIWDDEIGGEVTLNKHITDLFEYKFLTDNENRFSPMLERERKSIKQSFDTQAKDFGFLEDFWDAISKIKSELKTRFNDASDFIDIKKIDFFRDEGMTRFSLPDNITVQTNKLWEAFLISHQHQDREDHYLKVELTKLIYNGFLKNPKEINYDQILIVIAILYSFRKNEMIIQIIERLRFPYNNRYQIALIHAASMYKFAKRPGYLPRIDKVISDVEGCSDFNQNYKFWIGLGYIKFNVWKTLTTPTKPEVDPDDFYRRKYLKDSIKLTKRALEYLEKNLKTGPDEDERMVKYYYTLNNYIYYVVESQENSYILNENFYKNYITVLQTCQTSDQYRQNRFSDTIARYYLAKARLDKDDEDKKTNLTTAKTKIEEAINYAVLKDERFEALKNDIENELQTVTSRLKQRTEFGNDIRFKQ